MLAISAAVLLHAGVIAYLYTQQFSGGLAPATDDGPPILMGTYHFPPPKPVEHIKPQPSRPITTHPTIPQSIPDDQQLQVPPQPKPVEPVSSGSVTLNPVEPKPVEQTTGNGPRAIRDPSWLSRPSADELNREYPQRAVAANKDGLAVLQCMVTEKGTLTGCSVESETPQNFGFGTAAMRLSKRFRMSPRTEDGRPVDGASVRIPLKFSLQG